MKKKGICWQIKELLVGFMILLAFVCLFTFCSRHSEAGNPADYDPVKLQQVERYLSKDYIYNQDLNGNKLYVTFSPSIFGPAMPADWNMFLYGYGPDGETVLEKVRVGELHFRNNCLVFGGNLTGCIPVFGYDQFRVFCNPLVFNQVY